MFHESYARPFYGCPATCITGQLDERERYASAAAEELPGPELSPNSVRPPICVSGCPTCEEDSQNGDATGVECGGTVCGPCETCSDGIANQDETGVECGGPSCPACHCTKFQFSPGSTEIAGDSVQRGAPASPLCQAPPPSPMLMLPLVRLPLLALNSGVQLLSYLLSSPPDCWPQETRTYPQLDSAFDMRPGPNKGAVSGCAHMCIAYLMSGFS
eukprot:834148-Rhodomonas_salina.1